MSCKSFTMFGLPNTTDSCRLGITVTRKVGGAVTRNRIKRRFRELFRRHRVEMKPYLDLVINAHKGMVVDDAQGLEDEFVRAFDRLARGAGRIGR